MPIALHTTVCRVPYLRIPVSELWPRLVPFTAAGAEALRLSTADTLVQVLLQGVARGRGPASARWAVDGWHVLSHEPAPDWPYVTDLARRHRVSVTILVALSVIHDELLGHVPADVLDTLERDTRSRWRRVAALVPLTPGAPRGVREALRSRSWSARTAIAAAMLPPSGEFLRWRARER